MLQKVHSITWKRRINHRSSWLFLRLTHSVGSFSGKRCAARPAVQHVTLLHPVQLLTCCELWPKVCPCPSTTAGRREEGHFFLSQHGLVGWGVGLVAFSPSAPQPINLSGHRRGAVWKVKRSSSELLSQKLAWQDKSRERAGFCYF